MRRAWRFFVDSDGRWQWQMLGSDHTVIAASPSSYEFYEQCLEAAGAAGYSYQQAQPPLPRTRTSTGRSSAVRLNGDAGEGLRSMR